jgi:hypothetical protein
METVTPAKRPRGRPRTDPPPRSDIHARLPPAVKAQLERDAKRAHRSVAKEFQFRINESYASDEHYGGPQMAALFRELAAVALGVERQRKRGSFFEDFETFVFVRDVWQMIIQRQIPRPSEELLADVCREWDAFKSGARQTPTQAAVRAWLAHHTPMTLARALSESAGPRESASDKPAERTKAAATGEPETPPKIPALGSLARATQHLFPPGLTSSSFASATTVRPIGSIAMALESLVPSLGSARAAAREVSRLAGLLAEMTEGEAAGDTAVP